MRLIKIILLDEDFVLVPSNLWFSYEFVRLQCDD
jgi:hypothetical protein